jgi:hypothetical protein
MRALYALHRGWIVNRFPRALTPLPLLALLAAAGTAPQEAELDWPRSIETSGAEVVLYQPQPESFEGDRIAARFALSVTPTEATEPIFGVAWIEARVDTDRDARTVRIVDLDVTRVRFPESTEDQETRLGALLEEEIPSWDIEFSLDRIVATLAEAEVQREAAENLDGTPPTILFSTEPEVLITIDGEPILQPVDGSSLMRVVNTPYTIVLASGSYFLYAGEERWYQASALDAEWAVTRNVPDEVAAVTPPPPADAIGDTVSVTGPQPGIIVATTPTELIVTDGEPEYSPLSGSDFLYVSNSESDILLDIQSQQYYLVLSGRWYTAITMDGEWLHVPPADLPAAMATIPPTSEMGHLLLSVPGTLEAEEAILDSQIPQTSAIRRDEATLEVEYDGEPQFEDIEDTGMAYAVNTGESVIRFDGRYYACSDGVWFVSDEAMGPWEVADAIPDVIHDEMPADVPVYNVKYVYVFDSTPDVVYVGYYPGYSYSFVYGGTIVYGTGYYYAPWYGSVYYPHHATWGFHVRYNPWYGWGVGFSYSTGPFTFAVGFSPYPHYGGFWGPVGYRGYHAGYHRGWHNGYRAGARAGYRAGFRAGTRADNARSNIYQRDGNRARNADRGASTMNRSRPQAQAGGRNNVYSDRNGQVHRNGGNGWENRTDRGWQSSQGTGSADRARSQQDLNRSQQNRDRGTARTQSAPPRARGGRRR